jgi:hypothetical protein
MTPARKTDSLQSACPTNFPVLNASYLTIACHPRIHRAAGFNPFFRRLRFPRTLAVPKIPGTREAAKRRKRFAKVVHDLSSRSDISPARLRRSDSILAPSFFRPVHAPFHRTGLSPQFAKKPHAVRTNLPPRHARTAGERRSVKRNNRTFGKPPSNSVCFQPHSRDGI